MLLYKIASKILSKALPNTLIILLNGVNQALISTFIMSNLKVLCIKSFFVNARWKIFYQIKIEKY